MKGKKMWVEKHAPKTVKEMIGNKSIFNQIFDFVVNWDENLEELMIKKKKAEIAKKKAEIAKKKAKKAKIKAEKAKKTKIDVETTKINAEKAEKDAEKAEKDAEKAKKMVPLMVRALLLAGPPGLGKTTSAHLVATKLNYELVEINASDTRNKKGIDDLIKDVALGTKSLFLENRIILIDEVDGLSGQQDRGGVAAILDIVRRTKYPIIMTCNDFYSKKITSIRSSEIVISLKLKRVQATTISKVLKRICEKENIKFDPAALALIAENTSGDIRSAIMDLQGLSEGKKSLSVEDVEKIDTFRNRTNEIFKALKKMFNGKTLSECKNALEGLDIDYGIVMQWINENIPNHMDDIKEIEDAFYALSRADTFQTRIMRIMESNAWQMLPYSIELMSGGVALSRTKTGFKNVLYFQNSPGFFFRNIGKYRRGTLASITKKIRNKCYVSSEKCNDEYLPYLRFIFRKSKKNAKRYSEFFELNAQDERYLKKPF